MLTTYSNWIGLGMLCAFLVVWFLAMFFNIIRDIVIAIDHCTKCRRVINFDKDDAQVMSGKLFCCKTCKETYYHLNERM